MTYKIGDRVRTVYGNGKVVLTPSSQNGVAGEYFGVACFLDESVPAGVARMKFSDGTYKDFEVPAPNTER